MAKEFRYIIPQQTEAADEIFAAYRSTSEFYREIKYRQEFELYCQWYYTTGEHHRQELQKMRQEINILGWFRRSRR